MSIISETRCSDSPFVESITSGRTLNDGSTIRPAESHWHMVFVRVEGQAHAIVVGALPSAGVVSWGQGAEILWVKFKLGVFMPHLPARNFLNTETMLPKAAGPSFWLRGAAMPFPNFENADTFLHRLAREQTLAYDPSIGAALQNPRNDISPRTLRHRFLRATGLTQTHIRQMQRAQRAEQLLKQGVSILDTVEEAGYFDQPHLTRALKRWIGFTPAEIARQALTASNPISA
jgi:hypothetical protein